MSEEISIVESGVEVIGKITFSSRTDMRIEILSPFQNVSMGLPHIPYFALGHSSYDGEVGTKKAIEGLKELYVNCIQLRENLKTLREKYHYFKNEMSSTLIPQYMDAYIYSREKVELKKRFKNGNIESHEYQSKLKELKKITRTIKCSFLIVSPNLGSKSI